MATVSASGCHPIIKAFYQRLRQAGKPAKVALTTCMRKLLTILNAMLKTKTPWQPPAECRSWVSPTQHLSRLRARGVNAYENYSLAFSRPANYGKDYKH
jgi:hypothetical protein